MAGDRRIRAALLIGAVVLAGCGAAQSTSPAPQAAEQAAAAHPGGAEQFRSNGCVNCHSVDGTPRAGPTLGGIAGTDVVLDDGSTVVRDRAYLVRSLRAPNDQVVEGFRPLMPTYDLEPDDMDDLIAYLEALSDP